MKKIYLLIIIILLTFTSFLIIIFKPRSYTLSYNLGEYLITEKYIKNEGYYIYVDYKNNKYPLYINQKYTRHRKIIKEIKIQELEKELCLDIMTKNNSNKICSNNDEIISQDLLSDNFKKEFNLEIAKEKILENYKNMEIYNQNHNYLIWNYKGFYKVGANIKTLDLFKKDNYQNPLAYQTENYLIIPDYDSDYYFTKFYIYNYKKDTIKELKHEFEISYDSYYLGNINEELYLVDKKNQNEYKINLKKNYIEKISKDNVGKYFNGSKLEDISITKLINNELKFTTNNIYNYTLEDNKLYLNIKDFKILVTNKKVKKIVYIINDTVYYLSEDKLYSYKYLENNKLLIKHNEWLFNYNNHIFIFN